MESSSWQLQALQASQTLQPRSIAAARMLHVVIIDVSLLVLVLVLVLLLFLLLLESFMMALFVIVESCAFHNFLSVRLAILPKHNSLFPVDLRVPIEACHVMPCHAIGALAID